MLIIGKQLVAWLMPLINFYPKVHHKYVTSIEEKGGFFTDFWSSDTFDRNNFLKRNRIIAGVSEATVVIESAEKGDSLVTAILRILTTGKFLPYLEDLQIN
ncbi:DNA-processing protein DprA [Salegentibacter salinarum]